MTTDSIQRWQARITKSKDRAAADRLIAEAPEEYRDRLKRHADTVYSIRAFHERKQPG
jgi:hypothetical protein